MNTPNTTSLDGLLETMSELFNDAELISMAILNQISLTLVEERIKRNMTQTQFAKLLGVKQAQISKWESDEYNFTVKKLADIAVKLKMDLQVQLLPQKTVHCTNEHTKVDNVIQLDEYRNMLSSNANWLSVNATSAEYLKEN